MKKLILLALLFIPSISWAGGDSRAVDFISLNEVSENKYVLKYMDLESKETITVNLEYKTLRYLTMKFLSKDKYLSAIELLKKQITANQPARFGAFGGGPCIVDKEKNIFRSDALDIYYEEHLGIKVPVVYAFCEYK